MFGMAWIRTEWNRMDWNEMKCAVIYVNYAIYIYIHISRSRDHHTPTIHGPDNSQNGSQLQQSYMGSVCISGWSSLHGVYRAREYWRSVSVQGFAYFETVKISHSKLFNYQMVIPLCPSSNFSLSISSSHTSLYCIPLFSQYLVISCLDATLQ